MKTTYPACLYRLITILVFVTKSAPVIGATFQDLDFESATLPAIPPGQFGGSISVSSAFPGWAVYLGGTPQTAVWHNGFALGSSQINILGPLPTPNHIEGNHTALLQAGFDPNNPLSALNASLRQTGLVPVDAQSIQVKARFGNGTGPAGEFSVALGGQLISMIPLSSTAAFTLYAGNVSLLSGSANELDITAISNPARG